MTVVIRDLALSPRYKSILFPYILKRADTSRVHSPKPAAAPDPRSNMRVVRDARTVPLRRVCLRSFHLKRTRQNGRYSAAGLRSRFRGDILVSRPAHAEELLAGLQTVVPVPQRREQRRVADALHKKAGPGGPQLRLVVVGAHVQVEATRLLSRVEPERLLAEHLHKTQRLHPAQVGVRLTLSPRASRSSKAKPFVPLDAARRRTLLSVARKSVQFTRRALTFERRRLLFVKRYGWGCFFRVLEGATADCS